MKIDVYMSFDGNCAEAFAFYHSIIGGELSVMRYKDSPMAKDTPPEQLERVIHAELICGAATIKGGDAPPQFTTKPQGFCISLSVDTPQEADKIWAGLSDAAMIQMPLSETFWSPKFGMLIDKYSQPWMINCLAKV
jgi:PhnB protein